MTDLRTYVLRVIGVSAVIAFLGIFIIVYADSSGAKTTGTVTSTGAWTNLTTVRINTSDDSRALCENANNCDAGAGTEDGQLSDFTFNIPSGATIDGIELIVEARCNGSQCASFSGDLIEAALSWDNGSSWTSVKQTGELTTSDASYTLGGSSDTWGRSWSSTEFSDGTFQLSIGAQCSTGNCNGGGSPFRTEEIDYLTLNVYYTPATVTAVIPTASVQAPLIVGAPLLIK